MYFGDRGTSGNDVVRAETNYNSMFDLSLVYSLSLKLLGAGPVSEYLCECACIFSCLGLYVFLMFFVFGFGSGPVSGMLLYIYTHMHVLLYLLSVVCVGCVCCVVVSGSGMDV